MTPHLWQRQSEVSLSFQRKVRSCTFGQECASLINDIITCSVARGRVMFVISGLVNVCGEMAQYRQEVSQ